MCVVYFNKNFMSAVPKVSPSYYEGYVQKLDEVLPQLDDRSKAIYDSLRGATAKQIAFTMRSVGLNPNSDVSDFARVSSKVVDSLATSFTKIPLSSGKSNNEIATPTGSGKKR